jgi:hypothetical protein
VTAGGPPDIRYEFPLADSLSLSFQRYPRPGSGIVAELPRSWGALPVASPDPGELLVPVPEGEGVWVGLLRPAGGPAWAVRVLAHLRPGGRTDAVAGGPAPDSPEDLAALAVPPGRVLAGIARRGGDRWSIMRVAPGPGIPACAGLEFRAESEGVPAEPLTVRLVDPRQFRVRTGSGVPPLSADAPYGGWRLP